MTTIAMTFSKRRATILHRTFSRQSCLKRFRHFIEYSGWEERILLHEGWINKVCLALIAAFALYFAPILLKVFLR